MNRILLSALVLSTALGAAFAKKGASVPEELLLVAPLDTAAVTAVDSSLDVPVLVSSKARRAAPSDAALIARGFYPRFGRAIALAARKVEVIDSSAGTPSPVAREVGNTGDTVRFRVPGLSPDSARYVLVLGGLTFSGSSRTAARGYKAPTAPFFDPTTGKMNPGDRKGYSEGPGLVYNISVRARWLIWDLRTQAPFAQGRASGEAFYRGDATQDSWDDAARDLAKSVLKQTAFSPY